MPRLENSGTVVDRWYQAQEYTVGDGTSTFDLCRDCADKFEGSTLESLPLVPYHSNEPAGALDGEVDHPDYDECDYQCELCQKPLTSEDN